MAFNISPQVNIYEIDNSSHVETKGDTKGAQAGYARWGASGYPIQITGGLNDFAKTFFKPDDQTALSFFIAADFLKYSNKMYFQRVLGASARNAIVKTEV